MGAIRDLFRKLGRRSPGQRHPGSPGEEQRAHATQQQLQASGYTGKGWKCGRCGNVLDLPEGIKAKMILCSYCGFPIPNKRVGEAFRPG